jgi:hypothetical protein
MSECARNLVRSRPSSILLPRLPEWRPFIPYLTLEDNLFASPPTGASAPGHDAVSFPGPAVPPYGRPANARDHACAHRPGRIPRCI